ncbi:Vacuolar protein sorting 46 [Giardia muris]|uniref:Vacuolar protein sorting 46 n=1 Tax=Giardia muris TaxID=5742 RepID=A0A4Z1SLW8_GIAMU|nr:Vacuolar protein sorting 46 [Giardia muris]|eukprot:TNJ26540.1 Vacuolar protein sorting 46 [Giardia muris]
MPKKQDLSDQVFDLKFAAKQMEMQGKKLMSETEGIRKEIKKLIESNNRELATIRANILSAKKQQALKMYKLSGNLEVTATRLEISDAIAANASELKRLNKSLKSAVQAMDPRALQQILQEFSKYDEQLAQNAGAMDLMMESNISGEMSPETADRILAEVAAEHNLELGDSFADIANINISLPQKKEIHTQ